MALELGIGLDGAAAPGRDVTEVELTGAIFVVARGLGRDDPEHHAVEQRRAAEVLRKSLEDDLIVAPPGDEAEGAGADRVAGEARAALVSLLAGNDRCRVVGDQREERREWLVQADLD